MHATDRAACRRARDQRILQPLMIPLSVVVLNELAYRAPEVAEGCTNSRLRPAASKRTTSEADA
jgi:hypothetical protein